MEKMECFANKAAYEQVSCKSDRGILITLLATTITVLLVLVLAIVGLDSNPSPAVKQGEHT